MLVERSRSLLRILFALSIGMSVLVLGFAAQNARELASGATRRDVESKALRLQPAFQQLCANLRAALPADADVLLEPSRFDRSGLLPQSRWHLSFNYELAPIRCYTREPAAASGTLVDWPRWVERHFPGTVYASEDALAPISDAELESALEARRIRWRITYPQMAQFQIDEVRLWRRESGLWKAVDLAQAPAPEPARPLRSLGAALLVAVSLLIGGSGLVRVLGGRSRAAWIEWGSDGFAVGLGLAACAVLAWCLGSGGALTPTAGRALLGVLAVAGALGWWLARRRRGAIESRAAAAEPSCDRAPWTRVERTLGALCIVFCAYALLQAFGVPLHRFDSTQHFAYKARLLVSEGLGGAGWTDVDGPVGRIVTHPTYPPLAGALTALCSSVRGAFDPDAGKLLAASFVPLGALWLFRWLRPRSRTAGLLGALAWCGLPFLYYAATSAPQQPATSWLGLLCGGSLAAQLGADGYVRPYFSDLLDGTGDLPLAALCIGIALALRELGARGVVAGVLAAAALLVKNEGLPLVALLFASACVASPRRVAALPRIGVALAVAVACCAPWWIAKRTIPPIDENYGALLRPAHLLASSDRAGVVGAEYLASFGRVLRWNLLWPLCAVALVLALCAWRSAWRDLLALAPAIVGGLALYFAVLLVTPWQLQMLFSTYIPDRLFVHLAPLAVALVAAIAWPPRKPCA